MIILAIFYYLGVFLVLAKVINKWLFAYCKSSVCLNGKTAIVTGGNAGLGLQLVKALAARGCRVIIVDKDDAEETVNYVIKETHNPHISSKKVDLSKTNEVRKLAEDLNEGLDALHILVNNAGMADLTDGEKTFHVNYFGHFLLTHLLAGLLIRSTPSRIVFSSSVAAYSYGFSEKIDTNEIYTPVKAYQYSKLAIAMASRIFAAKLKDVGVTSNCCHPGFVKTGIWSAVGQNFKCTSWLHFVYYVARICTAVFGKTAEEGMQTILHLAVADEVRSKTGKFFMECTPCYQPWKVYDKQLCQKFWDFSEEVVGLRREEQLDSVIQLRFTDK